MSSTEKYLQALREAVGEEKYPLAVGQLRIAKEGLSPERRRELGQARSNEARAKKLNEWFGHFLAPEVKNFIALLAERNELAALDELKHGGEVENEAIVTAAREFSPETKKWFEKELSGIFGSGVRVRFREDKGLIGGVRIKVGDKEIDNSIRGKIAAIAK